MREMASTLKKPGLLPMCPATIWRMVREGKFPQPIRFSDRITAWRMSDVNAFIDETRGA
jgi:predicted DNA-binding transcriptional regulator AlpA